MAHISLFRSISTELSTDLSSHDEAFEEFCLQELTPLNCRTSTKHSQAPKFDFEIPLKRAAEEPQPAPPVVKCNCKNSKCLKLYCECFRVNNFCNGECGCTQCRNKVKRSKMRSKAVSKALTKNPDAFYKATGALGCNCRKSECQKGYCECFNMGKVCGEECRCIGCKNCE